LNRATNETNPPSPPRRNPSPPQHRHLPHLHHAENSYALDLDQPKDLPVAEAGLVGPHGTSAGVAYVGTHTSLPRLPRKVPAVSARMHPEVQAEPQEDTLQVASGKRPLDLESYYAVPKRTLEGAWHVAVNGPVVEAGLPSAVVVAGH